MIYVIVGGGIAGVSCLRQLLVSLHSSDNIILISASKRVKTVSQWRMVGQYTEQFDVNEDDMVSDDPRLLFIQAEVVGWNYKTKELFLSDRSDSVKYDRLCIATGALPSTPFSNDKVLTIRDTESAELLQHRLEGAKQVAVVGNGGIATEVVFELKGVNVTWIIRDDSISSVFFNPSIAEFFKERVEVGRQEGAKNAGVLKRPRYCLDECGEQRTARNVAGCALGPDWISSLSFKDCSEGRSLKIIRNVEVQKVADVNGGLKLTLSNGCEVQCDCVIWATGVVPATSIWTDNCDKLQISSVDGGIIVDDAMRTPIPGVYACGDVCSVSWSAPSENWKQMRLWTQARQMGDYCARSMMSDGDVDKDFCFELFTHTTSFFGYKVVFLGDFKAERQPEGWYTIERIIEDDQFVQCIMFNHRVVGAVLVGETDLEETMENLILNKTDLERIEENFLDPQIDIEDYFD
uniref:Pyridine nucleotide-disulfide oxidoreductase domain-containing protein 1 n=1 Tax=Haemonchus contortus TaxID=6289 RepID=A0A7I4Y6C2_HAECO|nr:FAD-dependent pyridine nucleotide-disulphide oxidoreductase domain containing protein [Haemonchus contortus]